MITQLKLRNSNAFLVQGKRALLIDTGSPGEKTAVLQQLQKAGTRPEDLSLILHTHIHSDHVGSTRALRSETGAPTAYHGLDEPTMVLGNNGQLQGVGLRGRILASIFQGSAFDSFSPDFLLTDGLRLDEYGVPGQILYTPGHTPGSISVLLDSGEAVIGDLLMGGYLGGQVLPHRPMLHYFAASLDQVFQSLYRLLEAGAHTLHPGHGGALSAGKVLQRFGNRLTGAHGAKVEPRPLQR